MAFQFEALDDVEAGKIAARTVGTMHFFSRKVAIDREAEAVFVDMGSERERDPVKGTRSFYNLLWGSEVFAAAGYEDVQKQGDGFVSVFALEVSAPRAAQARLEEATRLMESGLGVLLSGYVKRPLQVRVTVAHITYR